MNTQTFTVALYDSCKNTAGTTEKMTWDEFLEKAQRVLITGETHAEFMGWKNTRKNTDLPQAARADAAKKESAAKDHGGYIAGFVDGPRSGRNVKDRCMITLDADFAGADFVDKVRATGYEALIYPTHSHGGQEAPKYRVVMPMTRTVTPDEYDAVSRKVMEKIGIKQFDKASALPSQLMFWGSVSSDISPETYHLEGNMVNPDDVLAEYEDWTKPETRPGNENIKDLIDKERRAEDPLQKEGIIGDFCRAYDIPTLIAALLPDIYTQGKSPNRYNYAGGSGMEGLVLYNSETSSSPVFAYAFDSTNPANTGHLVNAWDLCRIHKFGYKDTDKDKRDRGVTELKSYKAMSKFAAADARVKARKLRAKVDNAGDEKQKAVEAASDWLGALTTGEDGRILRTMRNYCTILENDPDTQHFGLNRFNGKFSVTGETGWDRTDKPADWDEGDDRQLKRLISDRYDLEVSPHTFADALGCVMEGRAFDPLKDMILNLPEWDGTPRIETIFTDYLNAPDTPYTRAVAKMLFVAIIAKAMDPLADASKYDVMVVLQGVGGIGKSTLFKNIIGADYYTDSLDLKDIGTKDAMQTLQDCVIAEAGEMSGMSKADMDRIKNFISRMSDDYRESYGKYNKKHPRRAIVVGTTNNFTGFLRDWTGNRKYAPIRCSKGAAKDPRDITQAEREMMLAEGFALWATGSRPMLPAEVEEEAEEERRLALESDPREGMVREYANTPIPDDWYQHTWKERAGYFTGEKGKEGFSTITEPREYMSTIELHCELFGGTPLTLDHKTSLSYNALMALISDEWEPGTSLKTLGGGYGRQRVWTRKIK